MRIELRMDYDGEPYLLLLSEKSATSPTIASEVLERFISQARRRGIVMKQESSFEFCNDYASIRLKAMEDK